MSWYKRRPKSKEAPKHLPHFNTSPMTEKRLEETKNLVRGTKKQSNFKNK